MAQMEPEELPERSARASYSEESAAGGSDGIISPFVDFLLLFVLTAVGSLSLVVFL